MRSRILMAAAAMFAVACAASATPITNGTYNFTLTNAWICPTTTACTSANKIGTISGTFSETYTSTNNPAWVFKTADLTTIINGKSNFEYIFGLPNANSSQLANAPSFELQGGGNTIQLSLAGLTPSGVAIGSNSYVAEGGNVYVFGSVISAAPEPSSIALLGTGLLGLAGIARRRIRAV